jgi:hypothetical protein
MRKIHETTITEDYKIFYVEVLKITIMQKNIHCVLKKMYVQVFITTTTTTIIIILFKVTT